MTMYESSCSYQTTLDLKPALSQIKSEEGLAQCPTEWTSYRFHPSTFEQLKQSVEKAKAALHDRTTFLTTTSAFRWSHNLTCYLIRFNTSRLFSSISQRHLLNDTPLGRVARQHCDTRKCPEQPLQWHGRTPFESGMHSQWGDGDDNDGKQWH